MNPLHRTRSIKLKFAVVIIAAIGMAVITSQVGFALGWPIWVRPTVAASVAVAMVPVLARGMTRPLRDMARAAEAIAQGDYAHRVETPSKDEVGQLAGAFNAMAAELADADRQRRDLVANVSHELRTPIAGIKATLENLVDGVAEPTPATLAAMHERVERLHRLVQDLLDLSRLEAGTVPLTRRRLSVARVVAVAVDECRLDHPGVDIAVHAPEDLHVDADAERLHQVVVNLLDNAARHGDGPVVVTASKQAAVVHLEVADHGPGIPAGTAERVFERFYRTDSARSDDGGTGLGLAVVRWIVELHGGSVTASSDGPPGRPSGARFVVALPAA